MGEVEMGGAAGGAGGMGGRGGGGGGGGGEVSLLFTSSSFGSVSSPTTLVSRQRRKSSAMTHIRGSMTSSFAERN